MAPKIETAANPEIEKVGQLIKGIKVAMMVTVEPDGSLRGRPMMTQEMEFDGTLWFFSNDYSGKNNEIRLDGDVQLTYVETSKNRYLSLSGLAQVVRDQDKAAQLWVPALNAWFPEGVNDPGLSLIKVTVTKGEYWDGPSRTMVKVLSLAKAVKGETYKGEGGEHRKIDLNAI